MIRHPYSVGALPQGSGCCEFRVWAPAIDRVTLHLAGAAARVVPLRKDKCGYHFAKVESVPVGTDYHYCLDSGPMLPDPASRWQPKGVHGPSRIPDPHFIWRDQSWFGLPWRDHVLYELHVGTFTTKGTFAGVIEQLPELKALGITAIELMPVAQFPGSRNWGYDGVFPFAVQESYGGPAGLKQLVNAAHQLGMAVVLDVVYNHLGPEGNYFREFGPYFTDRYRTPWGAALNFDGPDSDEVRRYFVENALYWQTEFHIDGLRLDAVHAIRDFSSVTFLEDLTRACRRQADVLNRRFHLIAESDQNMARHILPSALGGCGLDAQWSDDFHHGLHVLLTGEQRGYYADFQGVGQFAKTWREGFAYTGEYSPHRRHRHGSSPRQNPVEQFVVCSQNHDQIGNRMLGDRLSATLSFDSQKLAAGALLLSPFIPMLFMGEEYGETAPFQYFISHSDPTLIEAVRNGRRAEFAAFAWQGEVPDPQAEDTFRRCTLNPALARQGRHWTLRGFYRQLLTLRRQMPALGRAAKEAIETFIFERQRVLVVHQWNGENAVLLAFNFALEHHTLPLPGLAGEWGKQFDSSDVIWEGPGGRAAEAISFADNPCLELPGCSFVLYQRSSIA